MMVLHSHISNRQTCLFAIIV